jgi:hypothetical protein
LDNPLSTTFTAICSSGLVQFKWSKRAVYYTKTSRLGADLGFDELSVYFASLRAAFGGLRLVREQIIVDRNFLAARTTFSGDFTGLFAYSPIGPVEPTGQHLEWEVIGIFRYDDEGRLAEEWVQTDYRGLLVKLGVTTTDIAPQGS